MPSKVAQIREMPSKKDLDWDWEWDWEWEWDGGLN